MCGAARAWATWGSSSFFWHHRGIERHLRREPGHRAGLVVRGRIDDYLASKRGDRARSDHEIQRFGVMKDTPFIDDSVTGEAGAHAHDPYVEPRHDERPARRPRYAAAARKPDTAAEHQPHPRIDDEHRIAVEPAAVERHQQPDAVVVQQVQPDVRKHSNVGQQQQRAGPGWIPSARGRTHPVHGGHGGRQDNGEERKRQSTVRPSAAQRHRRDVRGKHQRIDVGKIRRNHQRGVAEACAVLEPRFPERSAHERVTEVVH